jgi:hypothetical protein
MLKALRRIIDEAVRQGLTEALGGSVTREDRDGSTKRSSKRTKRIRMMASPEERATRATIHRISYN